MKLVLRGVSISEQSTLAGQVNTKVLIPQCYSFHHAQCACISKFLTSSAPQRFLYLFPLPHEQAIVSDHTSALLLPVLRASVPADELAEIWTPASHAVLVQLYYAYSYSRTSTETGTLRQRRSSRRKVAPAS